MADTHEMEAGETGVLVLDIPFDVPPAEATRLMNEPYQKGFYIHRALQCEDRMRVVYAHRAKPTARAEAAPSKEAVAMQFLRDNREMSAKELAAAFKALGFRRSAAWISEKRVEMIRLERRVPDGGR